MNVADFYHFIIADHLHHCSLTNFKHAWGFYSSLTLYSFTLPHPWKQMNKIRGKQHHIKLSPSFSRYHQSFLSNRSF